MEKRFDYGWVSVDNPPETKDFYNEEDELLVLFSDGRRGIASYVFNPYTKQKEWMRGFNVLYPVAWHELPKVPIEFKG